MPPPGLYMSGLYIHATSKGTLRDWEGRERREREIGMEKREGCK